MDFSGVTATTAGSGARATGDAAKLAKNFDDFLRLLTTQLKFQDPLSPMESNEFVAQLVQFTQVEQSIASNRNLEKLLEMQLANQTAAGIGYLGNTIEAASEFGTLQDGEMELAYSLGADMDGTAIGIYDLSGELVYSADGNTTAGKHSFTWDGTTNDGGTAEPGTYRLVITGSNEESELHQIPTAVIGKVTGVQNTDEGVLLSIGEVNIPIGNVVAVTQPPVES